MYQFKSAEVAPVPPEQSIEQSSSAPASGLGARLTGRLMLQPAGRTEFLVSTVPLFAGGLAGLSLAIAFLINL